MIFFPHKKVKKRVLPKPRATLSAISKIWSRPAHIETLIEGKRKLYSWINGDFKEEVLDEVPE